MTMFFTKKWVCGVALAVALAASRAEAGMLPVSATTSADGSNTKFTYGVVLTSNSTIQSGDYFTVYDFQGAVTGSNAQPSGWTLSVQPSGITPVGTTPTDSGSLPNLTWTYSGPTISGQVGLGNFSMDSTFNGSTATSFTAQTHPADGGVEGNITNTIAAGPGTSGSTGGNTGGNTGGTTGGNTPEPASLALLGLGLPFVGFLRKRRNRS